MPSSRRGLACLVALFVALTCVSWPHQRSAAAGDEPEAPQEVLGLPLVFSDDFEEGNSENWEPSDPKAWSIDVKQGNHLLSQFQQSKVQTKVRSPFNRALAKNVIVGDFVLDVDLQSTARDYDHRSLVLFFGFQDPEHMYYVHFGKKTDDHANQIFIVNNEPRKKISTETTPGTPWDDEWHHARVVRKVETGAIEVYFDDLKKPVMRAVDKTFKSGQVGIGSFDDTGHFDNVRVYGSKAIRPR